MGPGERCRKPKEAWARAYRYFWVDDRLDYGEERVITLGRNERSILVVVSAEKAWTENNEEEIIRIIVGQKGNRE